MIEAPRKSEGPFQLAMALCNLRETTQLFAQPHPCLRPACSPGHQACTWIRVSMQCPSPEVLVRGTTERAETHISGSDVCALTASVHGPGVSQCPCPEGPWPVACWPQLPTRGPSRHQTSCFCLCEAGLITSVPAGCMFPPVHQATGLHRFSPLFYGRCDASHGFRTTCIRRAESSAEPLATSFGGLQHFHGPHILYDRPSSQFCVNFLSVFVLFMLDVLAHILVFGSVLHLYASYIYVLCLSASPTLFLHAFFLRISLFSFYVHP
jgi:hypothetical protein